MRRALVVFAGLSCAGLAACNGPKPSPGALPADGGARDAASPAMATTRAEAPAEPGSAFAEIPVNAAVRAREALAGARAAPTLDSLSYLAFREQVACGEPFWRTRGFVTEALFGGGAQDETGGPLGRLDAAMTAGDAKEIEAQAIAVDRALQLLEDSFRRSPARRTEAPALLPRAAYTLGAVIAASKPGVALTEAGVIADALGLIDAIERAASAYSIEVSPSRDFGGAVNRVNDATGALRSAATAAQAAGQLSGRAALIVTTGKLGAALRRMLGSEWRPYESQVPAGAVAADEPASVLTIPRLHRIAGVRDRADEQRLADLGKELFFDTSLSARNARSCATCHAPEKAYADGKRLAESLDPQIPIVRNTPTLLYASLGAAQFWDGRALTSEAQAQTVLHSRAEMGGATGFPRPFGVNLDEAARRLAAFEARYLVPASAPLDRFARGDEKALSAEDRAGFDVFAGKGRCSRCHVPPLFGGSYPNDFATPIYAVLGVPSDTGGKSLDPDRGRGGVTRRPRDEGAFRTPTLRNLDRTAPFFHNGAFPALEDVVDFYDKGGGAGLGLPVPNQDPEVRPLKLLPAEKRALLRFLRGALADELPGAAAPRR
jgi:cytochrome c peroxidase